RSRGAVLDGSDGGAARLPADRAGRGAHHGTPAARRRAGLVRRAVRHARRGAAGPATGAAGAGAGGWPGAGVDGPGGHPGGRGQDFAVTVFVPLITAPTRAEAYRLAAGWLAGQLASPTPSLTGAAFYGELVDLHTRGGDEALATVPPEWWAELGAIGTLEDAA